jgi:hypothetical protein
MDDLKPMLRLTTSRAAYRRAGLVIGSAAAPTDLTPEAFEELGPERQSRLFADPAIEVAASIDGVTFRRISADDRAYAVERYQEFMTGQAEGADKKSPAPSPNASTASDAAAVSGDDAPKTETGGVAAGASEGTQPAADSAPAPVATPVSPADEGAKAPSPSAGKPSGRAPKAAKPKAPEAKAAS